MSCIFTVDDIYQPDQVKEAIQVFGADDPAHPAVAYLRNKVKEYYVGGKVQAILPLPKHQFFSLLGFPNRQRASADEEAQQEPDPSDVGDGDDDDEMGGLLTILRDMDWVREIQSLNVGRKEILQRK